MDSGAMWVQWRRAWQPNTWGTRNRGKGFHRVEDPYPDPNPTIPYPQPARVYPTCDNP